MQAASDRPPLAPQFSDLAQQRDADALGMWVLLATEVLFFGVLFTGYVAYRIQFHEAFVAASARLDLVLGTANTAVLITSSLSMVLADLAARRGSRRELRVLLAATAVLGSLFLVIKGVEYAHEAAEGLVPLTGFEFRFAGADPVAARMFFNLYFAMTGLHALHLAIGIGLMLVFLIASLRGRDRVRLKANVRAGALYWHFVDVVWIFLFPILYLVR